MTMKNEFYSSKSVPFNSHLGHSLHVKRAFLYELLNTLLETLVEDQAL